MSELTTADTNDSAQIPKPIGAAGANAAGATDAAGSAPKIFIIPSLKQLLGRADIGFAFAIMAILTVMILPLPTYLMDFALAISITFSILIMMNALFISKPLEFSVFPTVLLIATLLRLALNLASTRLILANGHEGPAAAGKVIEAFGAFVMQGNFIIGIIVFSILVLVNFVVITKGSGRIAEVAARFSLDAMPGKQMAIDADLSSGIIDEKEAKQKRIDLEAESAFFGSMDGASKFVKGDAIAGLIITFINVLGGIIVGVVQNDMSMGDAAEAYTLLTIGDGLVSQIPSLIVSVSAGLLVSKAGVTGSADKALIQQLSAYPKGLGVVSSMMIGMAFLPGIPMIPFFIMGGLAGYGAYSATKKHKLAQLKRQAAVMAEELTTTKDAEDEPIASALKMDELRLEIGINLLPLIKHRDSEDEDDRLTQQIKALRRQLATDMGFIMPSVRILDNVRLDGNAYSIRIKEVEAGTGTIFIDQLMVMEPTGAPIELPGTHTTEPTFGIPATWVAESLRDEANMRGYTVVDPATVLATHITETIKNNMADLLSYGEVKGLLQELPENHQKLLEDISPSLISVSGIQRVLQTLLTERVSIRDLPTILEAIAEIIGVSQNPAVISEHVRTRLARQICAVNSDVDGNLAFITLSPVWEQNFADSIVGQGDDRQLAMAPSQLQDFITLVRDQFEQAAAAGDNPVLLTSPSVRPYVRSIIDRFRNQTFVMSQNEIHPQAKLKTVGQI
ncbi:MAG: flagellar biosynthesis protein FlhA [Rhizobiales bacterium]|nr:flagellar biosynthesis protein FlhA [Hyphomicrobiales bacterium]NRB14122.1 flagellar biosynthesis protein FlhA [Hyphomicrobiales bacterium]